MIGHQAVAVYLYLKFGRPFDQIVEVIEIVFSLNENSTAIMASLNDMMRSVRQNYASCTRHFGSVYW